jgi:hypothetical protein
MSLATLTVSGRAAIAKAIAAQTLHFAWGMGQAGWDEDPDRKHLKEILIHKTALDQEIGRRLVTFVGFVTPDDEGDITVPIGRQSDGSVEQARYLSSEAPTPYLYLRVNFDYDDANDQIIREVAVFLAGQAREDLPPGQRYFRPNELADPGRLLAIQRLDPVIKRSPAVRQTFEFVLPI